jgi:hypothetical protein
MEAVLARIAESRTRVPSCTGCWSEYSPAAAWERGSSSAECDAICRAAYGERSPERTNRRNGYRERAWDTRAGTIELFIPRLRQGSYG